MRGSRATAAKPEPGPLRPGFFVARLALILAVALAGVDIPSARAQVTTAAGYLAKMDTDRDGRVSLDEYLAWMGYAFERMDRDGDGVLDADELPGGRGAPVTRERNRAKLAAAFRRQDADGDGFLSARELAAPPR